MLLPGASIFPRFPIVLIALGTRRVFLRESAAIPGFGHKGHAVLAALRQWLSFGEMSG
jgi:hypothetical protein